MMSSKDPDFEKSLGIKDLLVTQYELKEVHLPKIL